jgi:hypothetical protein
VSVYKSPVTLLFKRRGMSSFGKPYLPKPLFATAGEFFPIEKGRPEVPQLPLRKGVIRGDFAVRKGRIYLAKMGSWLGLTY